MENSNGIFIVLEGSDGSGKGTQFRLLTQRLRAVGYDVEVFDFPRYNEPSSHFIKQYLEGAYGPTSNISPYTASIFYALDRYEAAPLIKDALSQGKIVLADRFVGSNMAHQGGKFTNSAEQRGFFIWDDGLEYQMLGIPRPTVSFFLKVPAEVAHKLIAERSKKTGVKMDGHENDIDHLKKSVDTYDTLCKLFPKDFKAIDCTKDGELLSIPQINDIIWDKLKPLLPPKPPHPGKDLVVKLNREEETIKKHPSSAITNAGVGSTKNNITIEIKKLSLLAAQSLKFNGGIDYKINKIEWNEESKYNFFTPQRIPKKTSDAYKDSMNKLSRLHTQLSEKLKSSNSNKLLLNSTPLSALCDIKIEGGSLAINKLISKLNSSDTEEVRWLANQIHAIAHKAQPEIIEKSADAQERDSLPEKISKHIGTSKRAAEERVELNKKVWIHTVTPRNEFDLIADALFMNSNLNYSDANEAAGKLTYNQKADILEHLAANPDNPLLSKVLYTWNAVAPTAVVKDLNEIIELENIIHQPATPLLGWDKPADFEDSEVEDLYNQCFEEINDLYKNLDVDNESDRIKPYCTLLGNNTNWQFTTPYTRLLNSRGDNPLLLQMKETTAQVHPMLGSKLENSRNDTDEPKKTKEQPKRKPRNRRYRGKKSPKTKRSNNE